MLPAMQSALSVDSKNQYIVMYSINCIYHRNTTVCIHSDIGNLSRFWYNILKYFTMLFKFVFILDSYINWFQHFFCRNKSKAWYLCCVLFLSVIKTFVERTDINMNRRQRNIYFNARTDKQTDEQRNEGRTNNLTKAQTDEKLSRMWYDVMFVLLIKCVYIKSQVFASCKRAHKINICLNNSFFHIMSLLSS